MKHSSPMCMMANGIEKEESKKENGNGNLKRSHAWINALYSHLMQKNSSFSSVCLLWRSALFVLRSNFSPAAPRLGTVCACRTNTAELSAWICCISKNHSVANYRYNYRNHTIVNYMITLEKVYLLNSGPIFVSVASLKKKMLYLQLNTKMNVVIYYGHPYTAGNALERVERVHEPADLWDITFWTRWFWGL